MGRKRGQTEFQQSLSSRALLSRYNNYCCHSFLDPLLVSETNILVRISASWRVTKIFHIRTCYFCQAEWLLIFLGILLPNIIRDFRSCTLYLHPLLIRVVTEGSHPCFFQILYCFFAGEDEHTIISAAVPSWSILRLCQTERAGMQKYCVDCWMHCTEK